MAKIDFVLPWVDNEDDEWRANKNKYLNNDKKVVKDSGGAHRFRGIDIIKYVLRSIAFNCPWYNKIYLITEGHYPQWLDLDHPKIELITHEELYFNEEHLPTFSSRSIEMNLANLNQLSDKFVHLNDDLIIANPVAEERFFKDSKPVDFFAHGWVPRNKLFELLKGEDVWVNSLKNNIALVNRDFYPYNLTDRMLFHESYPFWIKMSNYFLKHFYKKVYWIDHWHLPQPYLKSTIQKTFNHFEKEMMITSSNRFRKDNDVNPYLYRYTQLLTGDFHPYYHNDGNTFQITDLQNFRKKLKLLKTNKELNFVCFNDTQYISLKELRVVKKELKQYLESLFPEKAPFEL